jgi:hypothetical protein
VQVWHRERMDDGSSAAGVEQHDTPNGPIKGAVILMPFRLVWLASVIASVATPVQAQGTAGALLLSARGSEASSTPWRTGRSATGWAHAPRAIIYSASGI